MQIGNSSSNFLSSYTNLTSGNKSKTQGDDSADFSKLADYSATENTLFQNLLTKTSVQDNVTLNEDGTYSWQDNTDGSTLSHEEWLTKSLICEQNGTNAKPEEGSLQQTSSDFALFRQTTGYNLVQVGQLQFVVDDDGNPPADGDREMVNAAWNALSSARYASNEWGDGGHLTNQEFADALAGIRNSGQASGAAIDSLLDMLA